MKSKTFIIIATLIFSAILVIAGMYITTNSYLLAIDSVKSSAFEEIKFKTVSYLIIGAVGTVTGIALILINYLVHIMTVKKE